jgi:hypothetical protein
MWAAAAAAMRDPYQVQCNLVCRFGCSGEFACVTESACHVVPPRCAVCTFIYFVRPSRGPRADLGFTVDLDDELRRFGYPRHTF